MYAASQDNAAAAAAIVCTTMSRLVIGKDISQILNILSVYEHDGERNYYLDCLLFKSYRS